MMSEEKSCDGVSKKRNALVDVTNLVGKRGLWEISGGLGSDFGDRKKGKSVKQVCSQLENLGKKEYLAEGSVGKERGKEILDCSRTSPEFNEPRNQFISEVSKILENDFQHGRIDDVSQNVADVSRDSCLSSIVKPTSPRVLDSFDGVGNQAKDDGVGSQGEQSGTVFEQFDTDDSESDEDELGDDHLDSSKSESIDCLRFPESQESRSSGLEKCVGFKSDGLSDSPVGIDLMKTCLCSFCTKGSFN